MGDFRGWRNRFLGVPVWLSSPPMDSPTPKIREGSFIHRLIEEALLEFKPLRDTGAPLDAELFVSPANPAGVPTVGNLAALEDDDPRETPTQRTIQRRGLTLAIVVLLLAVASLVWLVLR